MLCGEKKGQKCLSQKIGAKNVIRWKIGVKNNMSQKKGAKNVMRWKIGAKNIMSQRIGAKKVLGEK